MLSDSSWPYEQRFLWQVRAFERPWDRPMDPAALASQATLLPGGWSVILSVNR